MKISYEDIVKKVAEELELPTDVVRNTYRAYWKFIRTTIEELPLKEDLSDEEFSKLKTNFNIPSLGKLNCTLDRYKRVKKKLEYINKIRKKNAENQ